jgi:acyl transferase domain-containing protein/aryl carrier-like protein
MDRKILNRPSSRCSTSMRSQLPDVGIAIIGVAARFPGARDVHQFWDNLCVGRETIARFSEQELIDAGIPPDVCRQQNYVRAKGIIDDADYFDAPFFGMSPKEAELTDPQHRVFLECAWHALEDAAYVPAQYRGRIGIFAGSNLNTYMLWNLQQALGLDRAGVSFEGRIGNDKDYLTTRVSYKLGLTGPSIAVQTACSTSLVAVHLARRSLMEGECEIALAGASSITFPQKRGYVYEKDGMYPADGHCRPFDASSEGCPDGDGVAIVVLKLLDRALRDGDRIYAVIKGTAINNDGSAKVGFTAPSVERQAGVVREALAAAGLDARSIGYVETHGTGTPLGDLIEISALTEAYRGQTDETNYCALGSVKSNIGHLNVASGMAGLIKTVLCLYHKVIPPTLHFQTANPLLALDSSPFYVARELQQWDDKAGGRRAGVSSFGIGGTNAHVVLEECPAQQRPLTGSGWELLPLSARSAPILDQMTSALAERLRDGAETEIADVANTLCVGRCALGHRRIAVASDVESLVRALETQDPGSVLSGVPKTTGRPVVFMFTGLGDHYVGMAHRLYAAEPAFRETVDYCCRHLEPVLGVDLRTLLYPAADPDHAQNRRAGGVDLRSMLRRGRAPAGSADAALNKISHAHSALFVIEFALAKLLMSWGIRPNCMVGYSIGEYVAATLAGVMALEHALTLVARRAQLIEQLPKGAMLAVALPTDKTQPWLSPDLHVSASNGPNLTVVSGSTAAIADLQQRLSSQDVTTRRLIADYPFHSKYMEPIVEQFTAMMREADLSPPNIPFLSNVSGDWITAEQATSPEYWGRHLSETVRFAECVDRLVDDPSRVLVEVGPGNSLSSIVLQRLSSVEERCGVLASMRHRYEQQDDLAVLLKAIGRLWLSGVDIDWNSFRPRPQLRRVTLPGYPFERKLYGPATQPLIETGPSASEGLNKKTDIADWFYIPSWKRSLALETAPINDLDPDARWLIFADEAGLGARLADRIKSAGRSVTFVTRGASSESREDQRVAIDPDCAEHYDQLFDRLASSEQFPRVLVHLWQLDHPSGNGRDCTARGDSVASYRSLQLIARTLSRFPANPVHVAVLTTGVHAVTGAEELDPQSALLLGACKVIPQELPHITATHLDIQPADYQSMRPNAIDAIIAELPKHDQSSVALRNGFRWLRTFEPVRIGQSASTESLLRERGVYLITGGFGAIGSTLAEHLVRTVRARLILTGRSSVPERDQWTAWLNDHAQDDETRASIRRIQLLERLGGEVMVAAADVSDHAAMAAIVREARVRFNGINGVIHAAGVGGGGLLQLSQPASTQSILRPKVAGALVLDALFADDELDFFLLCSSVSSFIGGIGQSDHAASNAFLDTFAHWRERTRRSRAIAVNWDSWQLAGLAFRAAQARPSKGAAQPLRTRVSEALLEEFELEQPGRFVFSARLGASRHWILDEHRLLGRALFAGTGYIEMICEAARYLGEPGELEIRDLVFMFPMFFDEGEERAVRLTIEHGGDGFSFAFASRAATVEDPSSAWRNHAAGNLCFVDAPPPRQHDVAAFRVSTQASRAPGILPKDGALSFGPRWQNLDSVWRGEHCSLALLELAPPFHEEARQFRLHPALMDIATSFGIQGGGFYMPVTYKRLRVRAALTSRLYALLLSPRQAYAQGDVTDLDLAIVDAEGHELASVEGLFMKRIHDPGERLTGWTSDAEHSAAPAELDPKPSQANEANPLHRHLAQGILPEEGCSVLDRILTTRCLSQVTVSTVDLTARMKSIDAYTTQDMESGEQRQQAPQQMRPDLGTAFVAPRHALDHSLIGAMQDLLGVRGVGIDDNFFDLGGDSLRGIQLVNRLRKELSLDISLRSLYATPTVRALSDGVN